MATRTRYTQKELDIIATWKRKPCEYCESSNVVIRRQITSSGATQYAWVCLDCSRYARKQGQWIPGFVVEYWHESGLLKCSPNEIPIKDDYSSQVKCCVCGASGAELHHFAPESLSDWFGAEWTQWPTAYLCKYHHDLWHSIVTPWMPHVRSNDMAQAILEKYYEKVGV